MKGFEESFPAASLDVEVTEPYWKSDFGSSSSGTFNTGSS
jgi:hypothetical protein